MIEGVWRPNDVVCGELRPFGLRQRRLEEIWKHIHPTSCIIGLAVIYYHRLCKGIEGLGLDAGTMAQGLLNMEVASLEEKLQSTMGVCVRTTRSKNERRHRRRPQKAERCQVSLNLYFSVYSLFDLLLLFGYLDTTLALFCSHLAGIWLGFFGLWVVCGCLCTTTPAPFLGIGVLLHITLWMDGGLHGALGKVRYYYIQASGGMGKGNGMGWNGMGQCVIHTWQRKPCWWVLVSILPFIWFWWRVWSLCWRVRVCDYLILLERDMAFSAPCCAHILRREKGGLPGYKSTCHNAPGLGALATNGRVLTTVYCPDKCADVNKHQG